MLNFFVIFLNNHLFLFTATAFCTFIKIFLIIVLSYHAFSQKHLSKLWLLLIGVLVSSLFGDIAWITKLIRSLFFQDLRRDAVTFAIRVGWSFLITQYQIFALFLANFCNLSSAAKKINISLILSGCLLSLYFAYSAFFEKIILSKIERAYYFNQPFFSTAPYEIVAMRGTVIYLFFFGIWIALLVISAFQKKDGQLPKIIKKQLLVIFSYFAIPYLIYDFSMIIHFLWRSTHAFTHLIVGISTLIFTFGLYYCVKQILKMRFLNCKEVVEAAPRPSFVYYFQEIIEKLHSSEDIEKLNYLTDEFFEINFSVPSRNVVLLLGTQKPEEQTQSQSETSRSQKLINLVEQALTNEHTLVYPFLKKEKILVYDDLVLSNFYNPTQITARLIQFLDSINADIFLPIIEKERMIAFIIIQKAARKKLYSNIDRHEMILYAKYLATKINALLHDTDHCSHQEKKLKDDLYKKHLELAHYKESIRSFLITSQAQEIGIIFSHNGILEYANDSAKKIATLIGNNQSHPLLLSLKNSARYVERYQTPYNCYTCDGKGNRYMITAVYNHQGNNCIISISRADLTESISQKIALLNNPSRFDYLLYLETTKPGHRINTLIPGSAPDLLNFKVDLLEAALSKKATLLQAPAEDLNELVNFLHETSSRQILHTIDGKLSGEDCEQLLFGCQKNKKTSLLEQLNNNGTLFIKNIDALDLKVQKQLADVIKYGFFADSTNQKKICINVRIICSTHNKLSLQVKEGVFYQELYDELKTSVLTMPDLTLLKTSELADVACNYLKQQSLNTIPYDYLITLFQNYKPTTLYNLKTMVFEHAQNKIDKIIHDNNYLYDIKPEIAQAMRLGKQALKDPELMSQLWHTFKSQARIAEYLGVNRSSVNRRCKEYSLQ